jgi:hypothetical protein
MTADLFDIDLRAQRRDRAFRLGPELFLHERAFEDCLDRLGVVQRRFRTALLIGCPDPGWPDRLREFSESVDAFDPGMAFATAANGRTILEDRFKIEVGRYDLCVAVGTLDTVNDLPQTMLRIRAALEPDAFFLGALSGGNTLPQLRAAMRAADQLDGIAVPHVHPRIEASALAGLLSAAGLANPVVDVDRVRASYESLGALVSDLRRMGATNILTQRSRRSLSKNAWSAAQTTFSQAAENGRTIESFEILHFAAWTPHQG